MMGSLLERPLIHRDFQAKYPVLLSMYSRELDQGKVIFNQQISHNRSPQVHTCIHNLHIHIKLYALHTVGSVHQ